MSISKFYKIVSATLCFTLAIVAVSCSDSDDSENLSPEEEYDYPIAGYWVHSLQDYDSYLILDLDSDGTGIERKRYHGIMEYEIPILYEYEKGTLTIISEKNGSHTYKCQWIGDNSIVLAANYSKREYWDRTSKETNIGNGVTKYELASLIPECVSIETEYQDFLEHITIESTLHTAFPNATFDFYTVHRKNGLTCSEEENSLWNYSTSYEGNKKVVKFQIPYWWYYEWGNGNDVLLGMDIGSQYRNYQSLVNEGFLTKEEERRKNDLENILREHELEAKTNYVIEVVVRINDKWLSFVRNLRLSDDCK